MLLHFVRMSVVGWVSLAAKTGCNIPSPLPFPCMTNQRQPGTKLAGAYITIEKDMLGQFFSRPLDGWVMA